MLIQLPLQCLHQFMLALTQRLQLLDIDFLYPVLSPIPERRG